MGISEVTGYDDKPATNEAFEIKMLRIISKIRTQLLEKVAQN